ncbi:hypothetical protein [Flexivirga sp. B27]
MCPTYAPAQPCHDRALLDLWHPLGSIDSFSSERSWDDQLLGVPLTIRRHPDGRITVARRTSAGSAGVAASGTDAAENDLPVLQRYGYLWTSLGTPRHLFDVPQSAEPDRRLLHAGSVTVHTSAGRSIENFLDMAHFPFVHTGTLGEELHTEVKDYNVTVSAEDQEILATDCVFFQPKAAMGSTGGAEVDYTYRVPHPHCAILYKSSPGHPGRLDAIAVFIQAIDEEHIRAHMWLCLLDDHMPDWELRRFQVSIFGQDKPILENQLPRRLPLDPRAETPIRADKAAVAYRRWLSQLGIRYGVLPGAAA